MIQITNLWRRFAAVEVLRGVDLSVPEGSCFALLGTNGAGKTTTIKILMNLLQPTAGAVQVLGVDSRRLAARELAQIGYVADRQDLPGGLSVAQYLDYLRPFYPTWDCSLERSLLADMNLPPQRPIAALSHGMRLKLSLLAALVFRPRLLVLDEPFSGLDPLVRDDFMAGLLQQAGEMTILISSHELSEIEAMVTHVAMLHNGRVLLQQALEELSERVREVRVVLDRDAVLPHPTPPQWLQVHAFGNVLSFIDTRFSESGTRSQIAATLGTARAVDIQPVGLRKIFTALARAAHATAEESP